jgi:hypothetical protein
MRRSRRVWWERLFCAAVYRCAKCGRPRRIALLGFSRLGHPNSRRTADRRASVPKAGLDSFESTESTNVEPDLLEVGRPFTTSGALWLAPSMGSLEGGKLVSTLLVLAFLLSFIVTFACLYLHARLLASSGVQRQTPHSVSSGLALGMHVSTEGDGLRVSWNPKLDFFRSVNYNVLEINDGPRYRELYLDSAQVANGSILYQPASDDVTFRLKIRGDNAPPITEAVRVLYEFKSGAERQIGGVANQGISPRRSGQLSPVTKPLGGFVVSRSSSQATQ